MIVGAGPYGLAAAAHLRALDGVDVRIFGDPMSFWHWMPRGMLLRSRWEASHIAYPSGPLTLDAYKAENGASFDAPIPLEHFVEYGRWVQERVAPDVDARRITRSSADGEGFVVTTDDDERSCGRDGWSSPRASSPSRGGPRSSTACRRTPSRTPRSARDFSRFAGRNVIVVGGGQSALESAALLHESGAQVEVIARRPTLNWLKGGVIQRKLGPFKPVFYAPTDVGPIGLSRLLAVPDAFRHLPRSAQDAMARRAIRPAGAKWLQSRLIDVPLTTGRAVVEARNGNGVELELDDATTRHVDHVVLGTGYRVDLRGYGFLSDELVSAVRCANGYPVLGRGLESSVSRLHFLGAPAAWSFGPLMRFVSGTWWSGRSLARSVSA